MQGFFLVFQAILRFFFPELIPKVNSTVEITVEFSLGKKWGRI